MNLGTFATFLATLVFGIISTYLIVTSNLDKTIADKLNDSEFIKQIAEHVRIPFLIFDENATHVIDEGASAIIENIDVVKEGRSIIRIVVTLDKRTQLAPILISLNNDVQFFQATAQGEASWEYRALQFATTWADTPAERPPAKLFKLEIL